MEQLSKKAIETVAKLNDQLFEAEFQLESQKRAVSKYRYYLAADPTSESVLSLQGAMANLRAFQQRVDDLRRSLDKALDNIWEL